MAVEKQRRLLKTFLAEIAIYSVVAVPYFLLVLRYMGGWLEQAFLHDRKLYAAASLLLMLSQGVALELVTSGILRFLKRRRA